ncbi:MAG: TlpA disulfide reductase family protein, partial [Pyrinomonadaceae bacterium]
MLFATILLCAFLAGSARPVESAFLLTTGPAEKLSGIDGKSYDLTQMHGSVVLVSFGATWCTPCSAELFALEELKREYKDRPVKFFWVSIEHEDQVSDKDLRKYARARQLTFPVLRDPMQQLFGKFTKRVRLPLVVFYDKEGRADMPVHFGMGAPQVYKDRMRERLNKLL